LEPVWFAQGGPGHRTEWNIEDWWVESFGIEKRVAPGPSLDFRIESGTRRAADGGTWVAGRPAVFASAAERLWKERVRASLGPLPQALLGQRLAVELHFSLEPAGHSTDLDNVVTPVVGATGDFVMRRRIWRIAASKVVAASDPVCPSASRPCPAMCGKQALSLLIGRARAINATGILRRVSVRKPAYFLPFPSVWPMPCP
jgi:hypothetical protein